MLGLLDVVYNDLVSGMKGRIQTQKGLLNKEYA